MKNSIALLLISGLFFYSCSDDPEISSTRYVDDIFTDVLETSNVQYGENQSLIGIDKNLFLTVYEPEGDILDRRPAIVLAHGGAFISGSKGSLEELCVSYAKKGFVAITIDYRLIDDRFISDIEGFSEGVVLALGDMKAAIRFIRNDAQTVNTYGIDPDVIFAGGVSAGAIMANHIGFLEETDEIPDYLLAHINNHGGFEGNTNDLNVSSEVSGIVSFSGSLFLEDWIDADEPPIFMVHEELDPIVPCGFDTSDAFPFDIFGYGGCSLSDKAQEVGVKSELIFYDGVEAHVDYLQNDDSEAVINSSAQFLAEIISEL